MELFNQGGFEALLKDLPPEFEWHVAQHTPEGREIHSTREAKQFFESMRDLFPDYRVEAVEYSNAGPNVFLVRMRATGTGKGSELSLDFEFTDVCETRDGEWVRVREFLDHDEALRAARQSAAPDQA